MFECELWQMFIENFVLHHCFREARMKGVLLRWWQPRHNGTGHDQWALDHVEVVL